MKIRTLTGTQSDEYLLNAILGEPELHKRISEDGTPPIYYNINDGSVYFFITENGKAAGIIQTKFSTRHVVDCHVNFLDGYRHLAYESVKEVLKTLEDYHYGWKVLTCKIPETLLDVCGFAEKLGFINSGTLPTCYMLNGELVGVRSYYYKGV